MKLLTTSLLLTAAFSLAALAGEKAQRVEEAYPGLLPGALAHANLGELPDGVLLKSGAVQVSAKELQAEIDKVPELFREELKKNAPFVLEHSRSFALCPDCGHVFWKGTHFDDMRSKIDALLNRLHP